MQLTAVFACLCLVISAAASNQSDYRVACYVDTSTRRLFHRISPSVCTYIISSSAYIDETSSFKTVSQDTNTGCTSLKTLKERYPSLKTLLGVEIKQSRLEQLTENQASLDAFVDSALKYLKEQNYDGLELTWVKNTAFDEPPQNTTTLESLLMELKSQIEEDTDFANRSVPVSVTVPDFDDHTSSHNDNSTLSQYVDFISVLPSSLEEESQIDSTVKYWQDQGVDPKKLLVALPAILWKSRQKEHGGHSETVTLTPEKVEQPYGPGLMIAKQVCKAVKSGQTEFTTLTELESMQSLGEEVSWLLEMGLGGVGVVVLDIDNFADSMCLNCTESEKAVLESKVISVSPHPSHSCGPGPHSGHGHHHGHHHHHHHHHDRDGRVDDQSFEANDTGPRHGRHHGRRHHGRHHHERRHHERRHHGRGHHGHGCSGHGPHGHRGDHDH